MIYNEYELIYVARPELPPADFETLSEKVSGVIKKEKGEVLVAEDWGKKRLAYPIQKHEHGHYAYVNFVGPAELPLEVERNLRIDDGAIRFMTVRLGENINPDERRALAEKRQEVRQVRQAAEFEAEQARLEAEAAREAAAAARQEAGDRRAAAYAEAASAAKAEEAAQAEDGAEAAPAEDGAEAAPAEAAAEEAPAEAAAEEAPAEAAAEEAPAEDAADADKADA